MPDPITRQIKSVLAQRFGRANVRVHYRRGSSWLHIAIDWTPLDLDQANTVRAACFAAIEAAGIHIPTTWTDDDCRGETRKCLLSFNQPRYFLMRRHQDGSASVMDDGYSPWRTIGVAEANQFVTTFPV